MTDLSKIKKPCEGWEDKSFTLKFYKAMKRPITKFGLYRFKCWQHIVELYLNDRVSNNKGVRMY